MRAPPRGASLKLKMTATKSRGWAKGFNMTMLGNAPWGIMKEVVFMSGAGLVVVFATAEFQLLIDEMRGWCVLGHYMEKQMFSAFSSSAVIRQVISDYIY